VEKQGSTILVPAPLQSACKSALFFYDPGRLDEALAETLHIPLVRALQVSRRCLVALYVIAMWAMRASEYLSATVGDVMENDMLFIRGKKRSASYRIQLPGLTSQVKVAQIDSPGRLVSGVEYMDLYRACIRAGIGSLITGHRNASRTHLYRHLLADQAPIIGDRAAGDLLHHRSPTTINFYGVRRRRDHGNNS